MEPAKIDWKRVESIFVEDKLYENIHAPKWFDFMATEEHMDDEAWFCRADCKHPKTAEDFLKFRPTSKFSSAAPNKSRSPLSDRNQRDSKVKRRGQSQTSLTSCNIANVSEDGENQNPNLSTPATSHQAKTIKAIIKSSSEKKGPADDASCTNGAPRLKSSLSARNLFAGKDILSRITEFCTELKKIAIRTREKEDDEKSNENENVIQTGENKDVMVLNEGFRKVVGELDVKDKERKPLLELRVQKSEGGRVEGIKEKQRRLKRADDAENIPVSSINLSNIKQKGEDHLLQIRTNPPSPQCFSATRATPSKAPKSRLMHEKKLLQELKHDRATKHEKKLLQELKHDRATKQEEETEEKGRNISTVDGREPRAMDVFWFLKPCTLST